MEKERIYNEKSKKILELLAELLMSLKLQEGAIWAVFALLPKDEQRFQLMNWIVDELEKRTLTEVEIMEKVFSMED